MRRGHHKRRAAFGRLSFFLICLFLLAACGSDKNTAAEQRADTEAPSQNDALSKVEEQALSGELQLRADEQINEENVKDEAVKLEKEIEADLN